MSVPGFLIIGGMKCGSTTLFRDLETNPRIFFPLDKEPENLCRDDVLTPDGLARYEALFARAKPGQVCAEASTAYTKRPDFEGVPSRALRVCGPDLKIIYLVRDPVKRAISHHFHEYARGNMPGDIDQAVREFPSLINYSRYAMQVQPWLETFGRESVCIIRFEDYVSNRVGWCEQICRLLGIEPRSELIETDKVFNRSENKPVMRGPWRLVAHNPLYRKLIRPLLSSDIKDRVRGKVLPKAPPRPAPPSEATIAHIRAAVSADQEILRPLLASISG
ncbi:MAG: hypothetical protein DYG94_01360 [Leptolyngbya sp. PLA3]|nr:MAG: hypothetical protein EDM82_00520 [Cyanobacteria bacterium CYA]MCE7967379.1 hypothetical protein [Leptolyngbya sp. PL-A3]